MRKTIFHEKWWLDAVAPGRWRQVACIKGGRVVGSLPFEELSQAGMKICAMPEATRLLGPILEIRPGRAESQARSAQSITACLLQQIDKHDYVEMTLDTGYADITPFLHAGYEVKARPTLLLNCKPPLAELWTGLRNKTRNVIRRAREQLTVQYIEDVSQFTRFYEENLEGDDSYFSLAASAAATAAACDRKQCKIVAATDADGIAHAMVVFLWDDHQVYYYHSSRKKNLAHVGAVSLLLWTGIELAHSRGLWFDFDAGLAKLSRYEFLISFGGEIANRYEVARSTRIYRVQHGIRRIRRAVAARLPIVSLLKKKYGFLWCIVCGLCFT
jgi:Acetyltransferase (GNAT) domain